MSPGYIPAFTLEPTRLASAPQPAAATEFTPKFINDVASGRVELPTIPRVVQQLIAALGDANVDFRKIGDALSKDPVLSAKVLRLANSSYFGGTRKMASIDSAVAMIGSQALKRLIVACGVSSAFQTVPGIDLRSFWRDALLTATAAGKLAPGLAADPEEAYVCGLLHATGHLILCCSYPEIADAMFTGFAPVRGAELAAIEVEAFGIDHPQVGAIWVEHLGFPKAVSITIGESGKPVAELRGPLHLALYGGRMLAAALAQKDAAQTALAALPPNLRAPFLGPNEQPNAAFNRLYDGLLETEPTF